MRRVLVAVLLGSLAACAAQGSPTTRTTSVRPSSPPSAVVSESASATSTCMTAPRVEYTPPDGTVTALPDGATVTVVARVGQPITVRFVGGCVAGGRLMVNGTGSGGATTYTTVWDGQVVGRWTPTRAGTRTLVAAWACLGPMSCPLGILGHIRVVTPPA